jgi:hypothetical protein
MRKPTLDDIVSRGWTLTIWDSPPEPEPGQHRPWIQTLGGFPLDPPERLRARGWTMGYDRLVMIRAERGDDRIEVGGTFWKDAEDDLREEMAGRA